VLVAGLLVSLNTVVGHQLDAQDALQRNGTDLHLVEPGDEPVDGVDDLHGVSVTVVTAPRSA
jgi:hypothetical protein